MDFPGMDIHDDAISITVSEIQIWIGECENTVTHPQAHFTEFILYMVFENKLRRFAWIRDNYNVKLSGVTLP